MISKELKIGSNSQQHFDTSPEIASWAKKYNTNIADIQKIFAKNGNSISKTLSILRMREPLDE